MVYPPTPSTERNAPYRRAGAVRRQFSADIQMARPYYQKYTDFVRDTAKPTGRQTLLDVGCGSGISSLLLSELGLLVTGCDLDAKAFEIPAAENLRFTVGDGNALPFVSNSFHIVSSYQTVEHLHTPDIALKEMVRVVKPGGVLIVSGPNLLSLGLSGRRVVDLVRGKKGDRRSPFGNSLPGAFFTGMRNLTAVGKRAVIRKPHFLYREPDLRPPFAGDSDACFLLNPQDVENWARQFYLKPIALDLPGRSPLLRCVAGGTWVAFRKRR